MVFYHLHKNLAIREYALSVYIKIDKIRCKLIFKGTIIKMAKSIVASDVNLQKQWR